MADVISIRIDGDDELMATLGRLAARAPASAGRALFIEAEAIMRRSKRLVPVDLGTLRASGRVSPPNITSRGASVTLGYGGAGARYAVYVHEGIGPAAGRPPFRPPVEPFRPWARRVLGDERAAYPVAKAVGERGIEGKKFLERPFRQAVAGMPARLAKRIKRDIEVGARSGAGGGRGIGRQLTKGRIRRRFYY